MLSSVIVCSVELFIRQGTGIRTFSRSLVAALSAKQDIPLDLLISTRSASGAGMLTGSNILQKHNKRSKLSRLASILRLTVKQFFRVPLWPVVRRLHRVPATNALYGELLDKCFGELRGHYGQQATRAAEGGQRQQGFLCCKNLFNDAPVLFAMNRKLLHLSLPRSMRLAGDSQPVYHSPLPYPVVIKGCHNIFTIHDLIPISHPDLCLDDPSYFNDLVGSLLDACAGIHCISHYSAEEVARFYGHEYNSKIFVAHQPLPLSHLTAEFQQSAIERHRKRYENSPSDESKFILQVGSIEPKKNHQTTLDAFRRLREKDNSLRLVIIGKPGWLTEDLCDYLATAKSDGIEWLRSASFGTLIRYIQRASAVVFPSLVEGWGLPPLEAMSYGTPVVVSPIKPCHEACGSAALYMADPLDAISLSDNLDLLLSTPALSEELIRQGFDQVMKFSVQKFADNLLEGYGRFALTAYGSDGVA